MTDVIDELVSKKCITPAQHRKVRETEGNLGLEKVSSLFGINFLTITCHVYFVVEDGLVVPL